MITVRYQDKTKEIAFDSDGANDGVDISDLRAQAEQELGIPADAAALISDAIELDPRLIVEGQVASENDDDTVTDGKIVEFVNGKLEIECGANTVNVKNTAGQTVRALCTEFQNALNIPVDGAAHVDDNMVAYDYVIENEDEQLAFGRPAGDKGR